MNEGNTFYQTLWTNRVLDFVVKMRENVTTDYALEPHKFDKVPGRLPGQYHAWHVEMQLMVYFLNKHRFLPWDDYTEPLQLLHTWPQQPLSGRLTGAVIMVSWRPLQELFRV